MQSAQRPVSAEKSEFQNSFHEGAALGAHRRHHRLCIAGAARPLAEYGYLPWLDGLSRHGGDLCERLRWAV